MEKILPLLVTVISLVAVFKYVLGIIKGGARPALSTWLIMLSSTSLSLITYLLSSGWDFLGGILNLVDVLANVIIVTTIILFSGIKVKFRSFEKWYLIVALLIILFWLLTDNPFKANLLIQTLILVGYFPTIQKLVVEKKNTEPLWAWVIVYSAGLLALYPAINSGSILPMIYVGRTLIMQAVIIGLGLFYGYRNKRLSDGGI